jgi:hypothetical protein
MISKEQIPLAKDSLGLAILVMVDNLSLSLCGTHFSNEVTLVGAYELRHVSDDTGLELTALLDRLKWHFNSESFKVGCHR